MKGNSPEINSPEPALILKRNLHLTDWILFIIGVLLFSAGYLFLGPIKFAAAIFFLVLVAIAFFSPKYGIYILYGTIGMYVLVFFVNMMALAPQQVGLAYTIAFYIEGAHFIIAPLMVLYVAYILGFVARAWMQEHRYTSTVFERVLAVYLIFCVLWVSIGVANEHPPLIILTDIHIVLMYTFAIFIGRSFKSIDDLTSLFNFLIILTLLHWVFLIGFFMHQKLYTEIMFFMDLVRAMQGSSDMYSPLIPVMLAILTLKPEKDFSRFEKYYPLLVFLMSVRTVLCLSRGAMIQVFVSVVLLYFLLPPESRRLYLQHLKRQLLYAVVFVLILFIVAPSYTKTAFTLIAWRTTTGGDTGGMTQGSLKYRVIETEIVWEDVLESPVLGYGPGRLVAKRMLPYSSAALEPYVHNGFLWIMLKFGFIGLFVYLYVLLRYFISVYGLIRGSPPTLKALLLGTVSAMVGILAIVVMNNPIATVQGVIFVSFALGVVIFAEKNKKIDSPDREPDVET